MSVEAGGPADRAGLGPGDIVIAFGASPVTGVDELHRLLTEEAIDRTAMLTVLRGARLAQIPITPVMAR
jgi:serine protease Do